MRSILINFALFQLTWFSCVLFRSWIGILVAMFSVSVYLIYQDRRLVNLLFVVAVAAIGLCVDSALMGSGMFVFEGHAGLICPPWLVAIWATFATTFEPTWTFFSTRLPLAALTSAIAVPLTYYAGARLGAMTFGLPLLESLLTLAVLWAILMPLLLLFYGKLNKR